VSARLLRVGVLVPEHEAEAARARLLELVPQGFEEAERPGCVELAAYVDAATAGRIESAFPGTNVAPVLPGWEDAWRSFHRPVVAGGVWLGPPWVLPPAGMPTVVIDPGLAFGTGAHATTRLCVELLATLERGSLLDLGCGSGVLSIAGARLGYGPLVAVDSDPVAVEVARANALANGVDVDASIIDVTHETLPRADVAVANIALGVVELLLTRLDVGVVVTSGYFAHESPAARGWEHVAREERDGWAADHFRRATV
jgi:ribosomal protein L11 methyltransferase